MSEKPLAGKTVALMVANGFDEIEFTEPQKKLIEAGAKVKVVSRANGLVNGWYDGSWGHFFPIDADLADTLAIDYAGLFVPGGLRSIEEMRNDPHVQRVLKAFVRAGMPVALCGDAVRLLATVDMARGRTVTGAPEAEEELTQAGASWEAGPVVVEGQLVSASGNDGLAELISHFAGFVESFEVEVNQAA